MLLHCIALSCYSFFLALQMPDTSPTKSTSFSPETWYRKAYEESARSATRPAPSRRVARVAHESQSGVSETSAGEQARRSASSVGASCSLRVLAEQATSTANAGHSIGFGVKGTAPGDLLRWSRRPSWPSRIGRRRGRTHAALCAEPALPSRPRGTCTGC